MTPTRPGEDRRFARATLPRVSRTFALNIALLPPRLREPVGIGYLLCRSADALEDSWPGDPAAIGRRFDLFLSAVDGDAGAAGALADEAAALGSPRADLGLLAELPRVWRLLRSLPTPQRRAVEQGVATLARGMRRYATRSAARPSGAPWVDDEAELHDYCYVVAGCVGEMLTRLLDLEDPADPATRRLRLERAPVVGEALQLTNILLDWPADLRRGRCYLPASWLAEHGVGPRDLVGAPSPAADALAARLERLARMALARVPEYLALVPRRMVRYRLFCLWPARWALGSLEAARRDPDFPWGGRRPRLSRARLWTIALAATPGHGGAGLAPLARAAAQRAPASGATSAGTASRAASVRRR